MDYAEAITHLELHEGASGEAIRAAYSRLAKHAHPDTGGTTAAMATLNEAREVALADGRTNGDALISASLARELVKTQTDALGLLRAQNEHREVTDRAVRSIARYEVDRLEARKRLAALAAALSGGFALLVGFLRAAVLSGISEAQSETFAAVIGVAAVVAAGFALVAWTLGVRAKRFENLVEDASDVLSDRGSFLEVVTEIEDRSDKKSPWQRAVLRQAISEWVEGIGFDARGSVAELARKVGSEQFAKLLVAKGLELGAIEEAIQVADGRPQVRYELVWTPSSAGGGSPA